MQTRGQASARCNQRGCTGRREYTLCFGPAPRADRQMTGPSLRANGGLDDPRGGQRVAAPGCCGLGDRAVTVFPLPPAWPEAQDPSARPRSTAEVRARWPCADLRREGSRVAPWPAGPDRRASSGSREWQCSGDAVRTCWPGQTALRRDRRYTGRSTLLRTTCGGRAREGRPAAHRRAPAGRPRPLDLELLRAMSIFLARRTATTGIGSRPASLNRDIGAASRRRRCA